MKKFIFLLLSCAMLIAIISGNILNSKNKSVIDLIAISQIEAMAQNEDGTKVATCYMTGGGSYGSFIQCNSRTSSEVIYSCPSLTSGYKGIDSKCTK